MKEVYLSRVLVFLQQEMPAHKDELTLENGVLIFAMPPGMVFQTYYDTVSSALKSCVGRIRNLEYELDVSVRSPNQERDLKIHKPILPA